MFFVFWNLKKIIAMKLKNFWILLFVLATLAAFAQEANKKKVFLLNIKSEITPGNATPGEPSFYRVRFGKSRRVSNSHEYLWRNCG